jgi:transposase
VKIRKVWAIKGSKPIILKTGSHRKVVVYGSLAEDYTQLFRLYPNGDSDYFLPYLKLLHRKHPYMILFMDKVTYHKKEARVRRYLRKNRDTIKVRWFPSGFPEANPVEECWNQGKEDILGSRFYDSFQEFESAISKYYRTKKFLLDVYKYLCQ